MAGLKVDADEYHAVLRDGAVVAKRVTLRTGSGVCSPPNSALLRLKTPLIVALVAACSHHPPSLLPLLLPLLLLLLLLLLPAQRSPPSLSQHSTPHAQHPSSYDQTPSVPSQVHGSPHDPVPPTPSYSPCSAFSALQNGASAAHPYCWLPRDRGFAPHPRVDARLSSLLL